MRIFDLISKFYFLLLVQVLFGKIASSKAIYASKQATCRKLYALCLILRFFAE